MALTVNEKPEASVSVFRGILGVDMGGGRLCAGQTPPRSPCRSRSGAGLCAAAATSGPGPQY